MGCVSECKYLGRRRVLSTTKVAPPLAHREPLAQCRAPRSAGRTCAPALSSPELSASTSARGDGHNEAGGRGGQIGGPRSSGAELVAINPNHDGNELHCIQMESVRG